MTEKLHGPSRGGLRCTLGSARHRMYNAAPHGTGAVQLLCHFPLSPTYPNTSLFPRLYLSLAITAVHTSHSPRGPLSNTPGRGVLIAISAKPESAVPFTPLLSCRLQAFWAHSMLALWRRHHLSVLAFGSTVRTDSMQYHFRRPGG